MVIKTVSSTHSNFDFLARSELSKELMLRVTAGTVKLVGTSKDIIVLTTLEILEDDAVYASMSSAHNPYPTIYIDVL